MAVVSDLAGGHYTGVFYGIEIFGRMEDSVSAGN